MPFFFLNYASNYCFEVKTMKTYLALLGFILFCTVGCQSGSTIVVDYPGQIAALESELVQARDIIAKQKIQISNLQNISEPVVELITKVNKISLGRYSRLLDSNEDQKIDKLVVYLQVYDSSADLIKVAGSMTVELWDLNAAQNNMVSRWEILPQQLEAAWDGGLLADHYRLELPVANYSASGEQLNLKCRFIELLTGKSWESQKVIGLK